MPLNSFTWHLNIPETKTWDLVSPKGSLRQSLPSQECKEPFSLHLAEEEGSNFVGNFCFDGVIQKIQVHANISITAPGQQLRRMTGSFLNISVSEEITGKMSIMYCWAPAWVFFFFFFNKNPGPGVFTYYLYQLYYLEEMLITGHYDVFLIMASLICCLTVLKHCCHAW